MSDTRRLAPATTVWQRARAPGAVHSAVRAPAGMRVLIVDGDPVHSALLALALEHFGVADTVALASASAALAALASAPFALLVVDLDLPDMDGIVFLRRAAQLRRCRIVLASALDSGGQARTRALVESRGVALTALLAKPIDLDSVAGVLAACQQGPAGVPRPLARRRHPWARAELAAAFDLAQFEPYFQPLCEIASGRCTGVEILARWRHPALGLLEAEQFIVCLEREGMLDRLCETLLADALQWAAGWEREGFRLGLALNASALTVEHAGFAARLAALCAAHHFAPERLTLELTESALASDNGALLQGVTQLGEQGFRLAIDDFGVGYSALQRLAELPFTEIKIDRGFVSGALTSAKRRTILASMCALAQALGLACVAEGIEQLQELALLRTLGCPIGQGYLLGMPMHGSEIAAWCRRGVCWPIEPAAGTGVAAHQTRRIQ